MLEDLKDYTGVIHIHTIYSGDSSAELSDVIECAKKFNVDFVIITDHNSLGYKSLEGWHSNILVLVGEEISPSEGNHYLALDIEEIIEPSSNPQDSINKVLAQGGFGFIEHPFFYGNHHIHPFNIAPSPWTDWNVKGFTGLSIFNYTSDGGERMRLYNFPIFYAFPGLDKDRPNTNTVKKWDELSLNRKTVGIGTADAHLYIVKLLFFNAPAWPFTYYFNSIRTHILTRNFLSPDEVYSALKEGHCYISHNYLGSPKGFLFWAEDRGTIYITGDELRFREGIRLFVRSPISIKIRLIKNGISILEKIGTFLEYNVETPGVYRVETEVYHRLFWKPWVFTNPIYIL
ncbi:MAG: hypothetical protein N2380_05180 [bacterium]|nr:hypothetical protein [bacterium]